jgi:hypothetical protein
MPFLTCLIWRKREWNKFILISCNSKVMATLSIIFYFSIQERFWHILLRLNWNVYQTLQSQIIKIFIRNVCFFEANLTLNLAFCPPLARSWESFRGQRSVTDLWQLQFSFYVLGSIDLRINKVIRNWKSVNDVSGLKCKRCFSCTAPRVDSFPFAFYLLPLSTSVPMGHLSRHSPDCKRQRST